MRESNSIICFSGFFKSRGFSLNEIGVPERNNGISDKTGWMLAYKQDYC
jgi:hypothetical protein